MEKAHTNNGNPFDLTNTYCIMHTSMLATFSFHTLRKRHLSTESQLHTAQTLTHRHTDTCQIHTHMLGGLNEITLKESHLLGAIWLPLAHLALFIYVALLCPRNDDPVAAYVRCHIYHMSMVYHQMYWIWLTSNVHTMKFSFHLFTPVHSKIFFAYVPVPLVGRFCCHNYGEILNKTILCVILRSKQQQCQQTKPNIVRSDHIYSGNRNTKTFHIDLQLYQEISKFIHVLNDHFIFNRRRCHLALFYSPSLAFLLCPCRAARSCDCMYVWGSHNTGPSFSFISFHFKSTFCIYKYFHKMRIKKNSLWMWQMSKIWFFNAQTLTKFLTITIKLF